MERTLDKEINKLFEDTNKERAMDTAFNSTWNEARLNQAEKILKQAYLDAGELPQVAASEARKQMDRIRKELEKQ